MAALCTILEWLFRKRVLTWLSKSTGMAIPRFFAEKERIKIFFSYYDYSFLHITEIIL